MPLVGEPESRWDIPHAVGAQGQIFFADIVQAIRDGSASIEIKYDLRWTDTRNVYVEYECLTDKWGPSGIAKTQADLWVFVVGAPSAAFIFPTAFLRRVCDPMWADPKQRHELKVSNCPSRGVTPSMHRLIGELRDEHLAAKDAS